MKRVPDPAPYRRSSHLRDADASWDRVEFTDDLGLILDPIPRIDGISSSGDPLLDPRADAYLASGRRRRA